MRFAKCIAVASFFFFFGSSVHQCLLHSSPRVALTSLSVLVIKGCGMRQCGIVGDRSDPRCRKCILFVFNWISKCSLKLRMSFSVARYEIGLYILRTVEHSDIQNPDFIARLSAKCSISWTAVLQICFFFCAAAKILRLSWCKCGSCASVCIMLILGSEFGLNEKCY